MTKPDSTYLVTVANDFTGSAVVKQIEVADDIADLAFVGCEQIELSKNSDVSTLSLRCNNAFAAEIANTKGIAKVEKTPVPNVMPARFA